jgi:hypothetical protein
MKMQQKVISIMEFAKLCSSDESMVFSFDTSNQHLEALENARWKERFSKVLCMLNPSRIAFMNENGTLTLECVKFIIQTKAEHIGGVFQIVCEDLKNRADEVSFLVIADKIPEK